MAMSPVIQVSSPFGKSRTLLLTGDEPASIGRDPDNSLAFPRDRSLSAFHCVIELLGKAAAVKPVNAKRTTLLNGKPIDAMQTLTKGDIVEVGQIRIRFTLREINLDALHRKQESQAAAPTPKVAPDIKLKPEHDAEPMELTPERTPDPTSPRRAPSIDIKPDENEADEKTKGRKTKTRKVGQDVIDAAVDHARQLARLLAAMKDQSFDDLAIQLINARDQKVKVPNVSGAKQAVLTGNEGVMFLRALLLLTFRARATDLHIEPKRDVHDVRMRIDGMMAGVIELHPEIGKRLLRVIKVLGDIDISVTAVVQEGHFSAQLPDRHVDFRISFSPTMYGQKLVVRVLDPANAPQKIDELLLPTWMHRELEQVVQQNAGMILVCGPTGSGKTSTLYALLRGIDRQTRNVVTIEDPIEYQLDNVTQLPINESQGNSFASLLRSVLRQDPDVLLVGEIRDHETARIAMQAAMTGHLVFSTVHSQDTVGAIYRLLDLKVEPYLVASALQFVLAQRLVRKLCLSCRAGTRPTAGQINRIGNQGLTNVTTLYHAVGCRQCLDTGYLGRQAVFELLHVNNELKDVIIGSGQMQDIRKALRGNMFISLHEAGYQLVAQGFTTMDEIDRVMGVV